MRRPARKEPTMNTLPSHRLPRFASRMALGAALLVLAAVVAACGEAAGAQPAGPAASIDPNAVHVIASGQQFTTTAVAAPAGKPFSLVFESRTGDPHDISIVPAGGAPVFTSDVFSGPATKTFAVPALAAGTYTFRCDVHPGMSGTLTVQ